jgi:hypothetical protein
MAAVPIQLLHLLMLRQRRSQLSLASAFVQE